MSTKEKERSPQDRVFIRRVAHPSATAHRFQTKIDGKLVVTAVNREFECFRGEAEALVERYNENRGSFRGVHFAIREMDEALPQAPVTREQELENEVASMRDAMSAMFEQMQAMEARINDASVGMEQKPDTKPDSKKGKSKSKKDDDASKGEG